ncbi:unnamed protein product [Mytilus coruscus]|uniref:Ig-like domain-containing protein n=1 Tax=Mytilus coruscus TaxID=42192 RepID=A0A6J8DUY8_MYTCO|nr:unnamed protein product [Mytilus coruscus]
MLEKKFFKDGFSASLYCPFISTNVTVVWRGPPQLILYSINDKIYNSREQFNKIRITGNFTIGEYNMVLDNFTAHDEGIYMCDTVLDGQAVLHRILALVARRPDIIENGKNIILHTKAKTEAKVSLKIDSYEIPEITWTNTFKEGKRGLWSVKGLNDSVFNATSTLTPENEEQFGNYGIKIRNSAGSTDVNIELISLIVTLVPSNVTCQMEQTINITCRLDIDSFNFTFKNEWVHTFHDIVIQTLFGYTDGNMSTLSIGFCVYKDAGNYTCKWKSKQQEYSTVASVYVESRPILVTKRIAIKNAILSFEVEFYAKPTADSVKWYYDDNAIDNNEDLEKIHQITTNISFYGKHVKRSGHLATLLLPTYLNYTVGVYKCIIRNSFGYEDASFDEKEISKAVKRIQFSNSSHNDKDVYSSIWATVYTTSSAVIVIMLIGIIIIIIQTRSSHIYQTNSSSTVNNQQTTTRVDGNENLEILIEENVFEPDQEYEEIENVLPMEANQERYLSDSESSDESEVLPKTLYQAIGPLNVYEDLHNSNIELHTYLTCDGK